MPRLRWQVYRALSWCPHYKDRGGGLTFKGGSDGKAVGSSNGRAKDLRGGRKAKIEGYHQCETWVRRDSLGRSPDRPLTNGERQADIFLESKRKDGEKLREYHQERLDYLDVMASGPDETTTN